MPDHADPTAPPLDAATPALDDSPRDPGVIEGKAKVIDDGAPPKEAKPAGPPPAAVAGPNWASLALTAVVGGGIGFALTQALAPPPDVKPLADRIVALEKAQGDESGKIDALDKRIVAPPPADANAAQALKALTDRVAALESGAKAAPVAVASPAASDEAVKALAARVAALETSVAARPAADGVAPAPDIAPLIQRLDALDAKLAALPTPPLAPLEARVAALETALAAHPPTEGAAAPPDLAPLTQRIDALDAKLAALPAPPSIAPLEARVAALEAAKAAPAPASDGAALASVVGVFSARFDSGAPYASELETLKRLGASADALAALAPFAATGAPTVAKIAGSFEEVAPALAAPETPSTGSIGDRVVAKLTGLVRVRSKAPVAGDEPAAVVTQIRAALAQGDLAGALKTYAKLPEKARAAGENWRAAADARLKAGAAVESLRAAAFAGLKAPT